MSQKLVLIGSGMVGARFLERLLQQAPGQYDIRVFNKEPYGGYNRIMLSPVLAGETQLSDIMTHGPEWFHAHQIQLHTNCEIVEIDTEAQQVYTTDGESYPYDKLVMATGSEAAILPVPGAELDGVTGFRSISDVNRLMSLSQSHRRAVVIGGGLLGLEAANGLLQQGMDVTVVHRNPVLMNTQLDEVAGQLLLESLQDKGLCFELGANTRCILGHKSVSGVLLENGRLLPADLVVMAVGIRPNIRLGQKIGLQSQRALVVNEQLQTSSPNIYALGECVEFSGQTFGLVAPLYEQAEVLAAHLAGKKAAYRLSETATKLKVSGIELFSAGNFQETEQTESIVFKDLSRQVYRKIVLLNNRIQGLIAYGNVTGSKWLFEQLEQKKDVGPFRSTLAFGEGFAAVETIGAKA